MPTKLYIQYISGLDSIFDSQFFKENHVLLEAVISDITKN